MPDMWDRDTLLAFVSEYYKVGALDTVKGWLDRGDVVAVYENADMGSPRCGELKMCPYDPGDLPGGVPPQKMPDTSTDINWRYQLKGYCRVLR
jgi:hypothetical protein